MIKLALASLRYRIAASLATFIAVLLGCAMLIACGGLFESGLRLNAEPQRLAGAPIVVTGSSAFKLPDEESETVPYTERSGVDAKLATQIAGISGVERALPDVSFPAMLSKNAVAISKQDSSSDAPATVLSGHDWISAPLTPYTLREGSAPLAAGQVVLDAKTAADSSLKTGDNVEIAVNGQPSSFLVSGIAQTDHQVDAPAFFFASSDAQRFSSHPGSVDAIGVFPANGTSADDLAAKLTQQLPSGLSILTGPDRGAAEFAGINASSLPLILLSSVFGGMVLVVIGVVVSATISLSVRQRQRELALLRASGATPKQVGQMVVAETMIVAGVAAILGLVLGRIAGVAIFSLSSQQGVVPAALEFKQGIIPFAGGFIVALLAPYIAATLTARSAAKTRPIQALAEASIPGTDVGIIRRTLAKIFAVVTVGLAIATMFLDPEGASAVGGPAVLTGSIAVGLFAPELLDLIISRSEGFIRKVAKKSGTLAVINTRARATQFAAVLTPITLAVALGLGGIYAQTTHDDAAVTNHLEQFKADAVVSSSTGVIAPALLQQVRTTPGVVSASPLVSSMGWLENPYDSSHGSDRWPLLGVDAQDQSPVFTTPVTAGSLRDLTGNSVAVPASQADDLGIKVGDQVTVRLGDSSQANVRVVALLDSPSGYGSLVLPTQLLAGHTTAGLPSQILVRGDGDLVSAINQRISAWPGTTVGNQDLLASSFTASLDVQAWINYLLAVLAMAYAAIASINTLAVAILSRRREFAVQRLAGATRAQVTRMLFVEGTVVALISLILGTVISLFTVIPTAIAVGSIIPSGPVWVFLAMIVAVLVIVWPVTLLAARLSMKRKPIEAISAADG
jgi:putative ABC transport system permease protein